MQLIDSPLPLSPLARTSRRSATPPVPATETAVDHFPDVKTMVDVEASQPVTICDLDNATAAAGRGIDAVDPAGADPATTDHATPPCDNDDELTRRALELKTAVFDRLNRDGRWTRLNLGSVRNDMMRECTRGKRMPTLEAQIWTYSELDRLYPPEPRLTDDAVAGVSSTADGGSDAATAFAPARARESTEEATANGSSVTERVTSLPQNTAESSRLQGLGDVPPAWLPLPANASLAAEIGWVQANRLYVVEERGNTTIVRLDRAHEPAPSRAAIGWLETSIRSYAKYVDVVGKYLGVESDEASVVRRERMAIAEIRSLLDEMHVD